jgi:hypothetical protein
MRKLISNNNNESLCFPFPSPLIRPHRFGRSLMPDASESHNPLDDMVSRDDNNTSDDN